ncbi:dienelactone hydrolase family protein [Nocardioides perillae]|uniref:Dienelactone hydrolase n=1 Tax=Nocardioides perillae TaxID=1119534 RepID=A0A7Y9ULX2_9ACTN|nr:dienelactone hydrolase family protein [Nocardioides perillae]NYG56923.1 dienelactone hydrolase [Nocardioides perillae]
MAQVLLFHHVQGLTAGVLAFADDLRAAGHTVHAPDLFDGHTFDSVEEGFGYVQGLPDGEVARRTEAAVAGLPEALVYAGFSWGVVRAQSLAQTRPGARGALLYESCVPVTGEWAFGPWPAGVPVQVHGKLGDEFFDEDLPAARELVETLGPDLAELFTYDGDQHLFADRSLPSYDREAAALLTQRTLAFLAHVG